MAQPGASATGPTPRPLPARGPVEGRPFEITDMAPTPAPCAGARRSWLDAGSALSLASSRTTPRGSGSTDRGLCVLHEGPTYPKYPQTSSSSTPPSCSASRRRRQPPQSPGQPLSDKPKQQLSPPADPPHQCREKSRHPTLPEDMRQHSGRRDGGRVPVGGVSGGPHVAAPQAARDRDHGHGRPRCRTAAEPG